MLNLQKLKSPNDRIGLTFLLWFLTMPFGSHVGAVSLGVMTIYPNLIITLLLFASVIRTFRNWNKVLIAYFLFLIIWILYALAWSFWEETNADYYFDLRSLMMQLLFSGVIIGCFYKLGVNKFQEIFKKGVLFYLVLIAVFGFIEFATGFHFQGTYTEKLHSRIAVDNLFYSATFTYDNPNDYIAYLITFVTLYITILWHRITTWKAIALLLGVLVLAVNANARIAVWMISGLILFLLIRIFLNAVLNKEVNYWIMGFGLLFAGLLIANKPLFIGPKYKEWSPKNVSVEEYQIFEQFRNDSNELSSDVVRKNLFLNGVEFIKESPILGIGPGQFKKRHREGEVKMEAGTVVGPHNYTIELVSQYGFFGWGYLLFILFSFIKELKYYLLHKRNIWLVLLYPIFGMLSIVPSSFLYLDINWLLIPFLFVTAYNSNKFLSA